MMDAAFLSIAELGAQLAAKALSPIEVTRLMLDRISRIDPELRSFITVTAEMAIDAARQAEREIATGRHRGPLHGVPICLKDLIDTRGVRTTCGSRILADYVPDADATAAARLTEAGAILIGKNNLSEFAMGPTGENAHYGAVRNPWDRTRVSGGSSSGSAAAVAAGLAYGSLGSDTGGSIRIPAALCGVVGLKPTYGLVSRFGAFPLSWTLDTVGPITRTVEDAAILLGATAGYDPRDPGSADRPVPNYRAALARGVADLRLGILRSYFFDGLDAEVESAVEGAIAQLRQLGAATEDIALPRLDAARDAHAKIMWGDSATVHLRWLRSRPEDYSAYVRTRLEPGALSLAVDYVQAQRVRAAAQAEFGQALTRFDLLVTPTVPVPATPIGESARPINATIGSAFFATPRCTFIANVTGLPALTVPCGFTRAGLPIGLQLIGRAFDEATLFRAAHAYERATDWRRNRPPIETAPDGQAAV